MGFFDLECAASGIVLSGPTRLCLWLPKNDGSPGTLLPPLLGSYDRLGGIDGIWPGPLTRVYERLADRVDSELEALFGAIREGEAGLDGEKLAFSLVDDFVYRAAIATVASRQPQDLVLGCDHESVFREFVGEDASDPRIQHELANLAHFMHFGFDLASSHDAEGDQFTGYERVAPYTDKALAKYASHPFIIAAIEENRERWQSLDREDEADGDEDEDEDDDEDDDENDDDE